MKRFLNLAMALCLLCVLVTNTNAAETQVGTINIVVKYQNANIDGGDLVAVKVGYLEGEAVFLLFPGVTDGTDKRDFGRIGFLK